MPTDERKYTQSENKARRFRAAEANVTTAQLKVDRAAKKVQDARDLEKALEAAKANLEQVKAHRRWVASMPVTDGSTFPEGQEVPTPEELDAEDQPAEDTEPTEGTEGGHPLTADEDEAIEPQQD